jgi:hypothetical protein
VRALIFKTMEREMTYLLWVAGAPAIEFYGPKAAEACAKIAIAVEGAYHAATACALVVGA